MAETEPGAYPAPSEGVREFASRGEKIQAINLYREQTGAGLKDAKDAVEALDLPQSTKKQPNKIVIGIYLILVAVCVFFGRHHHRYSATTQVTTRVTTTTETTGTETTGTNAIGTPPEIHEDSDRTQIDAFVAYFADRGFPKTDLSARYYPSGRIKAFHYSASHGRAKVTASIDTAKHETHVLINDF